MDIVHLLPFLSTGITLLFTAVVFGRYFRRHRRPHLLLWGIGLTLYAIGTFAEAYLAVSWSPLLLRLWYLSGAMLTAADMATLTDILRDTEVLLLSDEVYEHIVFDGRRHESVLRYPELAERSFVISSFGKTYHCTGWKIGYCIAPPVLSAEFRKVHQYNSFCSFGPAQWAFAEMIEKHPEHYDELGAFYEAKRDHFAEQLAGTKLKTLPVPGGYFQLVDYSLISDLNDAEFCRWLTIEKGVAAIPLSPFYEAPPARQRLARLCFAKNPATLDAAIERLAKI